MSTKNKEVKKTILIGWDGAIPQVIEGMIAKGKLPHVAKLIQEGTLVHALNPFPTITAQNWTTLSTGAWPGRHGITGYSVHHPGDDLDKIHTGFDTRECSVEHIWDAAEKVGKRSVLIKYETSWPPTFKNGIVVDGCGPNLTDEFHLISGPALFSTDAYPMSIIISFKEKDDTLTTELSFDIIKGQKKVYLLNILEKDNLPYKAVIYTQEKKKLSELKKGQWSSSIKDTFIVEGKEIKGTFAFRLLSLPDKKGNGFKLLATSIMPEEEFTYPKHIGSLLIEKFGYYLPRAGWDERGREWIDDETYFEMLEYQHQWLANACQYLLSNNQWDICYIQTHAHDYAHHLYMRGYDPLTAKEAGVDERLYQKYLEDSYESADKMLGRILPLADEETLVIVVSDHGATTWINDVPIADILEKAGLLKRKENEKTGLKEVVWEETKAIQQRACYVYVNLKGRDPKGVVEPGEEYERVRDKIIEAFYDYVDPKTGKRPFTLVLRREDARIISLYGDRVGDIVYALRAEFGHEHGQQLPTGKLGRGSLESFLVMKGPNIKKGIKLNEMTGLQDVVPTICYLMDIPFPQGCQGALIYDALEDPDWKTKKLQRLEKELERWKAIYEKQVSIMHNR